VVGLLARSAPTVGPGWPRRWAWGCSAYDPFISTERAQQLQVQLLAIKPLFRRSRTTSSLHLPRTPDTRHLVDWLRCSSR